MQRALLTLLRVGSLLRVSGKTIPRQRNHSRNYTTALILAGSVVTIWGARKKKNPVDQNNSDSNQAYTHKVTIYAYRGTMWDHSAVKANKANTCADQNNSVYVSVYPETHFHPPVMRDAEDLPDVLLNYWRGLVRPAAYCPLVYERREREKATHEYRKIVIPVTRAEHERLNNYMSDFKSRPQTYSVFNPAGYSCASFSQEVLEILASGTDHEHLVQRNPVEHLVVWPNWVSRRAQEVSEHRQSASQNRPGARIK